MSGAILGQANEQDVQNLYEFGKNLGLGFQIFDDRIRQLDRWKWATWGALIVIGALCGYYVPATLPFK